MIGGKALLDQVKLELKNKQTDSRLSIWVNVWDNSLAKKWLTALDDALARGLLLQKNYCFLGFADSTRNGDYLCAEINRSIAHINHSGLDYTITDHFSLEQCLDQDLKIQREQFNRLHRCFEELQGVSGEMSSYWQLADNLTRWHISQLNLLCHEFECWALSWHKKHSSPEWQRPSQLMCWNHAPRFALEPKDHELFGINTIARPLGGVFVGVNKAVGKHHWEVFQDEGRNSRINELITTTMRSQTEAAADFDIEWGQDPGRHPFMHKELLQFREWLEMNGFDPDDPTLTIGHPQIGEVDLERSFATNDYGVIWSVLSQHDDIAQVATSRCACSYDYHWSDKNYIQRMIGECQ